MTRWEARDRTIRAAGDPIPGVMGIVNITPDSFSDGGRSLSAAAAAEHARGLIQQGADLLDLGAESTRPGSDPVPLEEELRRLLPVLEASGIGDCRPPLDRHVQGPGRRACPGQRRLDHQRRHRATRRPRHGPRRGGLGRWQSCSCTCLALPGPCKTIRVTTMS